MPCAPRHRARVLEEGLGLGRAACGVVSTTATSTRLLPLLDAKTARGFIIDHTPGALYSLLPTKQVPTSHVIYEAPAALLPDPSEGGGSGWGVYGKVLRSP